MPYKDPARLREYRRVWMAARRAAFFADKSCLWCGSKDNLELDHIDPAQKVSHRIWSWAKARREAEIAKCQVLCRACHKKKGQQAGDLRHTAVLTPDDILEIREALALGEPCASIARRYPVGRKAISHIKHGKSWATV